MATDQQLDIPTYLREGPMTVEQQVLVKVDALTKAISDRLAALEAEVAELKNINVTKEGGK